MDKENWPDESGLSSAPLRSTLESGGGVGPAETSTSAAGSATSLGSQSRTNLQACSCC